MSAAPSAAGTSGLVIASNRLPVSVAYDAGSLTLEPSSGGLVAALGSIATPFAWIGWPGAVVPAAAQGELRELLAADSLFPVLLDLQEETEFYGRLCNDTLWPLFHDFADRQRFSANAWRHYVAANERFAREIAARSARGASVWIHDFHLLLVPALLRRLRPDVAIGFFLHVPFPAPAVFRLLPSPAAREALLLGLLGADSIGFHTADYVRHFRAACLDVLGIASRPDLIALGGRSVELAASPIGIDSARFRRALAEPGAAELAAALERRYRGRRLVLGVDRLDFTKGIPQKLRAFERFLERDPARAETTLLLQVLVPSRLDSAGYRSQRDEIERETERINRRFGRPGRLPVEHIDRSVSPAELVALYRRADVMAVTPLRDGMNLVAQEFVLCQTLAPRLTGGAGGVLLLSEFAGAAHSLPGALLVNPRDNEGLAERLGTALALGPAERRARLDLMRGPVESLAAPRWAEGCLARLARTASERAQAASFASSATRGTSPHRSSSR